MVKAMKLLIGGAALAAASTNALTKALFGSVKVEEKKTVTEAMELDLCKANCTEGKCASDCMAPVGPATSILEADIRAFIDKEVAEGRQTNIVYPGIPAWHIREKSMPNCMHCGLITVLTAYDCFEPTCHTKTICSTCAQFEPACGHERPVVEELTQSSENHGLMQKFGFEGRHFTRMGPGKERWTFQAAKDQDVVLCDACMAHTLDDVWQWLEKGQNDMAEAFIRREHNLQVDTKMPMQTVFDPRGRGCISNSGVRYLFADAEKRTVHLCYKCHAHVMAGGKPEELFKSGWRLHEERAASDRKEGDFVIPALSSRLQAAKESILRTELVMKLEKIKEWQKMTF